MSPRTVLPVVLASAALSACGESGSADPLRTAQRAERQWPAERERPRGVVVDCSSRSEANFSGAYSGEDDVVVGPLALLGAGYTDPDTIRRFGGDKIMALLRPGHRVTVALPRGMRHVAALGYGPLPELTALTPADGHRGVTFVSCAPGRPSGSMAGGRPVTFWSGFVLAASPVCVPVSVWVDDEPSPRHAVLRMGVRRCPG